MFRSIFFASGLFVTLCGATLLFVDKLVMNNKADDAVAAAQERVQQYRRSGFRGMLGMQSQPAQQAAPQIEGKMVDPPDWAAFSLLSVGTVTMLYAVALPRKKKEG